MLILLVEQRANRADGRPCRPVLVEDLPTVPSASQASSAMDSSDVAVTEPSPPSDRISRGEGPWAEIGQLVVGTYNHLSMAMGLFRWGKHVPSL